MLVYGQVSDSVCLLSEGHLRPLARALSQGSRKPSSSDSFQKSFRSVDLWAMGGTPQARIPTLLLRDSKCHLKT